MRKFIINGRFLEDRMQGIVRYSTEIVKALDETIDENYNVILVAPPRVKNIPVYKNIKTVVIGKRGGIIWEQTSLRSFVNKNKDFICINLCNVSPLFVPPGITTIHDIMYKVNPHHYSSFRNRLSRMWHCLQYSYVTKHEKIILTDSEFSKNEIEREYPIAKGKISVVSCGWQHVLSIKENEGWQNKYPFLSDGNYFFSLSTLSKNKNGKWIIEVAKKNSESVFVMAGKMYETEYSYLPDNVFLLGFISDEDAYTLIKHCKAFIFPSTYEGFGLPPLEALALGAVVISSNSTSLPEVLGKSVHYIDPYDSDINLESILKEEIDEKDVVLKKYSWLKSAQKLMRIIQSIN